MKKVFKFIAAVAVFACACVFACGCTDDADASAKILAKSEKEVVIEATKTGGSLADALGGFKASGELELETETSEYGLYIVSVGGYVPDASRNEFWAVYTTLGEYEGVKYSNEEYGTHIYGDKTLASANYGISGLPLIEGEIYIITISSY